MTRVACLWSTRSKRWSDAWGVANGIGNPFEYLVAAMDGHDWHVAEAGDDEASSVDDLLKNDPEVLMISALTAGSERALRIAECVRRQIPSVKVVWGGWHAAAFPRALLEAGADTVVIGPGETALAGVGGDPVRLPGGIMDVRRLPRRWVPARKFSLGEMISPGLATGPVIGGLSAIEGCNKTCRFCAQSTTRYYLRPVQLVIDEVAALEAAGARGFFLLDGNPMANKHAFAALCEMVRSTSGERLRWRAFGDCSSITEAAVSAFRRAGGRNIYVGLETPDSERAANYGVALKTGRQGKNLDASLTSRAATIIREAGVYVTASLIVGDPRCGDDIDGMLRELESVRPDFVALHQLMPIPGTPMWDELVPLLRPGIGFGDLDQSNPDGYFYYRRSPKAVMEELLVRYFGGTAYAGLVDAQMRRHGDAYRVDMIGPRAWLAHYGLDPWHGHKLPVAPLSERSRS